jgi:hypothetical protein
MFLRSKIRRKDGKDHRHGRLSKTGAFMMAGAHGGAASGDEIIDEDDPFTRNHGVIVDFHLVQSIFKRIGDRHFGVRQFAFFADRHEARRKLIC